MRVVRARHAVISLFALLAAGMMLSPASAQAATAQSATTTVRLMAGPLSISTPTADAVASVPLDGTAQSASVPLNGLTVTDATGTGAGWHLSVQATPLQTTDRQLPVGSLRLCCPGLDRVDWVSPGHLPTTAAACLLDTASAVVVTNADPGDAGMGSFSSGGPSTIVVNVPADTSAGTYRSTVYISLITGP